MNEIFLKKFPILNSDGTEGETSLKDLFSKNEKTLLYFYPKDNTPGCTLENKAFNFLKPEFNALGIKLVGISRDNIESHKKFVKNLSLENDLISDPTLELHKFFGAYGEKNNYGKIVEGVIRSTFLLDKEGNIIKSWINVKATNHAEKVLNELK